MRPRIMMMAVGALMAMAFAAPASAGLSEAGELEAARANARAGGPTSERDKELLQRWGCSSGTDSAFCNGSSHREQRRVRARRAKVRARD